MKILLLGDYSNFHATLGAALARMGHHVTVASDGCGFMHTRANIPLRRILPGKAGGALLFTQMYFDSRLCGHDVVSLISPAFVRLKPARLASLFEKLVRTNGGIFLSAGSTDKAVMEYLTAPDCDMHYCEYFVGREPIKANAAQLAKDMLWCTGDMGRHCERVYEAIKGATTALYEYHPAMVRKLGADKVAYTGIPIDVDSICETRYTYDGKLRLFLGRHATRQTFKGTDRIGRAAQTVAAAHPAKCTLEIIEDLPLAEYTRRMQSTNLVLDQLYSYTPATNALMAMAMGKAVLSGGEAEYYRFIGEDPAAGPIFNAIPDDDALQQQIEHLVLNPGIVQAAAAKGREFVRRHNDAAVVAQRHIDFWLSKS